MAANKGLRQAKLAAEFAHLVLEQFAKRLDELHVHAFGQAADIVVAFDCDGRAAGEADAFDHVRVQGALRQEIGAADRACLLLEDVDKGAADELALRFRVGEPASPSRNIARHPHGRAGCCSDCGTG
jgi:hypothetical protein